MDRSLRSSALVLLGALLLVLAACENSIPSADERQALEEAVRGYLNGLAEAYSEADTNHLAEHATPREIAEVNRLLRELRTTGDRLDATLLGLEVEQIEMSHTINATVRLLEVWDVGRYDSFNGREKGRNPHSIQHTVIQMRRIEGKWMVISRMRLEEDQAGEEPPPETAPSGAESSA